MNIDQVYLNPDLVIEPLFNNRYTCCHLISSAAVNIIGKHFKTMDSFIHSPAAYIKVVKPSPLEDKDKILLNIPFGYTGLYEFNKMRKTPSSLNSINFFLNTHSNMAIVSGFFLLQNFQKPMKST